MDHAEYMRSIGKKGGKARALANSKEKIAVWSAKGGKNGKGKAKPRKRKPVQGL